MEKQELNKYLSYCRIISRSVWRLHSDLFSQDDLYSAAEEGLAVGLSRYNPEAGNVNKFLWEYIRGYVNNEVRKRLQDQSRCASQYESESNDDSVSPELRSAPIEAFGCDATQDDDTHLRDLLTSIKVQIDKMSPNERNYAVLTLAGYNGNEIAEEMNVTPQYVCQLRRKVISTLQVRLRAKAA